MRYCSAGVLWRGRCVGMGDWRNVAQIWVYSWDIWSFSILEFWRIVFYLHGVWGCVGVCVVVECVTPGSQVITLSIQGARGWPTIRESAYCCIRFIWRSVKESAKTPFHNTVYLWVQQIKLPKDNQPGCVGSHVEAEYTEQDRKLPKMLESKDLIEFFCPATEITLGVCSEMIELCRRQKKKVQGCMLFSKCWVKTFLPTDVEENVQ